MIEVAPPRILSPSPETLLFDVGSERLQVHTMAMLDTPSKPYLPCHAEAGRRPRGKVLPQAVPQAVPQVDAACSEGRAAHCPPTPTPSPSSSDAALLPTADDCAALCLVDQSDEEASRTSFLTQPMKARSIDATGYVATHNYGKCNKRRRVSFGTADPTVHPLADVPPAHAMTPGERSAAWYGRSDLGDLKSAAQETIQSMRERVLSHADEYKDRAAFRSEMLRLEDETGASLRGLEHRVFRRKRTRSMLVRDVLACQGHIDGLAKFGHRMDPEERLRLLAKASRERSAGAKGAAFADAQDDYAEAYGGGDGGMTEAGAEARDCKRQRQARQVSM